MDISDWREDYTKYNLKEEDLSNDPFVLFKEWFDQATVDKNPEPNAMIVSTVSADLIPDARVVLLKGIQSESFIFYTNYQSQKGQHIHHNPNVSLLFFWQMSQRQVRVQGVAKKMDQDSSKKYFDTRPEASRISAIASPQSQIISSDELLRNVEKVNLGGRLECPEHWGGYLVMPSSFEFWQGGSSRLHDRIQYKKTTDLLWEMHRLAP